MKIKSVKPSDSPPVYYFRLDCLYINTRLLTNKVLLGKQILNIVNRL